MQHPYRRNENGAFCGDQPLFANKKYREKFLTSPRDDPQGDCREQQATKNCQEQFLTPETAAPQGWLPWMAATKNGREQFSTIKEAAKK